VTEHAEHNEPGELIPFPGSAAPDVPVQRDAERVDEHTGVRGKPVDPPEPPRTIQGEVVSRKQDRRPILPGWARTRAGWVRTVVDTADLAWYSVRFHAVRLPKYAAKTAAWAPVGACRVVGRVLRWAAATDGTWQLMQAAASKNDPDAWLKLDKARERHTMWRWPIVAVGVLVLAVAVIVGRLRASTWVQLLTVISLSVAFAWAGRPEDRPITDRVTAGKRFVKLTAEMVRTALCSVGLAAIKEPSQIKFPTEIHRDGPGYLARVDLPLGVEAFDVIERRGKLSSALRLPVDQVWPEPGPDHAGQIDLWVGLQPASKMGQPKWSLTDENARTSVFEPTHFATTPRQRPVGTTLFEKNFLMGGQPGSGKSYAARTIALIAALDPTCELKIAEYKGVADFGDLAHLCSTYVCGVDDDALLAGAEIIAWGLAEAERRGERIRRARERGEAPHGKVTPELAAKPGSGLHPVVIVIDEAHELFLADKAVAAAAERLIKRGRALAIIVVLATQIPDKSSLPPNITRCVAVRWCLSVTGQVENDMILGTGAYKRGLTATAYRPGLDAGWGVLTGLAEPTPARSFFPTPKQTAAIVARATALRGGTVIGGDRPEPTIRLDVLRDLMDVFTAHGRAPGLHWATIAELLADAKPELYGSITPDALSAMVRAEGVPSEDVKREGVNRKGVRLESIAAVLASRELR
jgi:S-DNA-T family DNA segregation ATPase FtsK/SpoIIIE